MRRRRNTQQSTNCGGRKRRSRRSRSRMVQRRRERTQHHGRCHQHHQDSTGWHQMTVVGPLVSGTMHINQNIAFLTHFAHVLPKSTAGANAQPPQPDFVQGGQLPGPHLHCRPRAHRRRGRHAMRTNNKSKSTEQQRLRGVRSQTTIN